MGRAEARKLGRRRARTHWERVSLAGSALVLIDYYYTPLDATATDFLVRPLGAGPFSSELNSRRSRAMQFLLRSTNR
jgi:hypothetical protein